MEALLEAVEVALGDADATLSTVLGDQRTITPARLWHGQVLVDWEPDAQAGDCLLRPGLLRRLLALHARVAATSDSLTLEVPGRIIAGLSPEHAALVRKLGGARRVEMTARLSFEQGEYRGGTETFNLVERGKRLPLLQLTAEVHARSARGG